MRRAWVAVLALKLRRLRHEQRVVLGADGHRDLVAHAADLDVRFTPQRHRRGDNAAVTK